MTLLLLACAAAPLTLTVVATEDGVDLVASDPVDTVEILDATGVPVTSRQLPAPSREVAIPTSLAAGSYRVRVHDGARVADADVTVPPLPPVRVRLQVVPGQPWVDAAPTVVVPLPDGAPVDIFVAVAAGPGHPPEVPWSGGEAIPLPAVGSSVVHTLRVGGPTELVVGDVRVHLDAVPFDTAALAARLGIGAVEFPAGADGAPEPARSRARIPLPSPAWQSILRTLGLGIRARDPWAPWAYVALDLGNTGAEPADVVVTAEVRRDGAADPAFRPRVRGSDGDTGTVAALARLAPGKETRVALPVFVDEAAVHPGQVDLLLTTRPLGGDRVLATRTVPLVVTRGDGLAGAGFAASCVACVGGIGWMVLRGRDWLDRRSTTELMTIALFGAALFVVGSASDIVSMAVGALLGPFSPLVVGILADVGRTALLGTLLTLYPRPGTLALGIAVAWLGRSFATGGFSPVDILYAGASVGYGETFAWLAGLTRSGDWRDAPAPARFLRLAVGFGGASAVTTLSGLWMHMVLFRLYFAGWYLALQTLVPGFLYVLVACALTVPFAASLRRVQV